MCLKCEQYDGIVAHVRECRVFVCGQFTIYMFFLRCCFECLRTFIARLERKNRKFRFDNEYSMLRHVIMMAIFMWWRQLTCKFSGSCRLKINLKVSFSSLRIILCCCASSSRLMRNYMRSHISAALKKYAFVDDSRHQDRVRMNRNQHRNRFVFSASHELF